jgi:Arc/MetJ-type ribon-helix-helix transcriptional regulator
MSELQTATVQVKMPVRLLSEMQALVGAGFFCTLDELTLDALRHFLESYRTELMERFASEDVEWGLYGDE